MKVLVAILSLVVLAQGFPRNEPCQLQKDLQDLVGMIDTDAIAAVLFNHLDDPDMQQVFAFLFSAQFRDLYLAAASQPEIEMAGLWMESQCVDLRPYLNAVRDFLELPPVHWNQIVGKSSGVSNFWDDLIAALDLPSIRAVAEQKYVESPAFTEFMDHIRSDQARALYAQLAANETYQYVIQELRNYGIDIDYIRGIIQEILGW